MKKFLNTILGNLNLFIAFEKFIKYKLFSFKYFYLIRIFCVTNIIVFSTAFSKMFNEDFKYRVVEVISYICERNKSFSANLQVSVFFYTMKNKTAKLHVYIFKLY